MPSLSVEPTMYKRTLNPRHDILLSVIVPLIVDSLNYDMISSSFSASATDSKVSHVNGWLPLEIKKGSHGGWRCEHYNILYEYL